MALCLKGLHVMSEDNIVRRKSDSTIGGYTKTCRACYNERLKLYMREVRRKKKERQNAVDICHAAHPD